MNTVTCFYLAYAMSTICYQQQPVAAIPPATIEQPAPAPSQGSAYAQPAIPTWQDIIRQQNESDDE